MTAQAIAQPAAATVGCPQEFALAVYGYYPRMLRHATFLGIPTCNARDVVSDVVANVLQRHYLYQERGHLLTYLKKCIENRVAETYRQKKKMRIVELQEGPFTEFRHHDEILCSMEEKALLGLLPSKAQQVLYLRNEGYNYREIGEKMHLNPGTCRILACHARKTLLRVAKRGRRTPHFPSRT